MAREIPYHQDALPLTDLPKVSELLAYQEPRQPVDVKAVPESILIQPNALSGDGVKPTNYNRCDVISLYLVRVDGSREWLADISKSGTPGADYSKIHTTAARYSMDHMVYIQPFDIALLK